MDEATGNRFSELAAISNFSFLRGAAHPQEMVLEAATLGYQAIGLADRNTLAGVVRAHAAARDIGLRFVPGARLVTQCGFEVIAYPHDRAAYGALSQCLTRGNRRAGKGQCLLYIDDILKLAKVEKFCWLIVPPPELAASFRDSVALLAASSHHVYTLLVPLYGADDAAWFGQIAALADWAGAGLIASFDPLYHNPMRRPLQDVVVCIRHHCTLQEAGYRLAAHAERYLKPSTEAQRLFEAYPNALRNIETVLKVCTFSLDELAYQYPEDAFDASLSPQALLEKYTWEGAAARFPDGVPAKLEKTLHHELALIDQLSYAPYFLTVHDIVNFARRKHILCQGRGSAANSAVCYCVGITAVDPSRLDLLFERFISAERNEPPDIDIDFEHERREEVIQYIYQKYGRDRAGIAATVITYRSRSAVREVAKVMGLSADIASALLSVSWGSGNQPPPRDHITMLGLDPDAIGLAATLDMAAQLIGFPRHLSQHVGGFVVTNQRLDTLVPIGNAAMQERTFIEWDKDDLDTLGILKIDILALGMLSAIRRSFDLIAAHHQRNLELANVPPEDSSVYDMLCRGESIGVFQVESRAQMNMLPRLKPRDFYDLVIEVAIVRPGPIQGDMVHPYLRRRNGEEAVEFPSQELEDVLSKTLGVPLFQEQAMRIAVAAAGFTPSESDQLRRAMATFRKTGVIHEFGLRLVNGMVARGYEKDFAERCFRQIEGFGEYGFPESHAASFAFLVYVSAWLKHHYPAAFCAALINSQPMGFYAPAQLLGEARRQGVVAQPVCINASDAEADLEINSDAQGLARVDLRLGFNQITGLASADGEAIVAARQMGGAFDSVADCARRVGLGVGTLERLARADAFASLGLSRRQALWAVRALAPEQKSAALPLFDKQGVPTTPFEDEASADLPALAPGMEVLEDYASLRLSLRNHPLAFLRAGLQRAHVHQLLDLQNAASGRRMSVAGLVICRQRPGSAKGVVFLTLEDETGTGNIVVWPDRFEQFRATVIGARLMRIEGRVQRSGIVVHLVAERLTDISGQLMQLMQQKGVPSNTALPKPLRGKGQVGRRTPREMPWRGEE
ncbi:MAG: error-prone DNA polymerase [Parvibaculales bacterium]